MRVDGSYPENYRVILELPEMAARELLKGVAELDGDPGPTESLLNKCFRRVPRRLLDDADYYRWLARWSAYRDSKLGLPLSPPSPEEDTNRPVLAVYRHDETWLLIEMVQA